jgi:hypothetical protein
MTATVAMIVMRPALGTMEVAMLPAENTVFSTFSVAPAGGARAAAAE